MNKAAGTRRIAAACAIAVAAWSGLLQAADKGQPVVEYQPPWTAILYAVVFVAGICVVAFKNAKRTHLD